MLFVLRVVAAMFEIPIDFIRPSAIKTQRINGNLYNNVKKLEKIAHEDPITLKNYETYAIVHIRVLTLLTLLYVVTASPIEPR